MTNVEIPNAAGKRPTLGLNHDWRFTKRHIESSWFDAETEDDSILVDLPHCWNDKDTFQVGLRYYQGDGAYARTFQLPDHLASMRSGYWVFVTEGFYGIGDLWLNGRCIAQIDGQYIGIRQRLDLKPFGMNTIGMRLDNRYHPQVLPGKKMPDFLLHGGLAGRAYLEFEPLFHLIDKSVHVHCPDPMTREPKLEISTVVRSDVAHRVGAQLRITITDPDGAEAAKLSSKRFSLGPMTHQAISFSTTIQKPRRWRLETPCRYRAMFELIDGDEVIDVATRHFGIRETQFRADGFYLNNERVQLYGANRHESMPGFGNALPTSLHREDAELMKRIGFNLVRLSHYPQHPAFLDACDEFGILVYAEIASWKSVKQGAWLKAACRQMRAMVLRDRHHPSVVLWGMGNESRSGPGYRMLHRIAHSLDGTRQTIYAENHLHRGIRWRTLKLPDVLGVNYEIDRLDDARRLSRSGAVLMSECSNCPRTYRGDPESETKQIEIFQKDLDRIESHDFVAGYCLWSFNDYATQRKQRFIRCSGVVDPWRVPKASADYLSSRIKRDATGSYRATSGEAAAIELETDSGPHSSTARDTVSILCRVVDENGVTVYDWQGEIDIAIEGPGRARLHNKDAVLPVTSGVGRFFITSTGSPGTVTITASHLSPVERGAVLEPQHGGRDFDEPRRGPDEASPVSLASTGKSGHGPSIVPLEGEAPSEPDALRGQCSLRFHETSLADFELPLPSSDTHPTLSSWTCHQTETANNTTLQILCAPGEEALVEVVNPYWSGDLPGLEIIREHKWGGRVQSLHDAGSDRTLYFKRFAIRSPRYLHKPRRARHTILQEEAIRRAGFRTARSLCLAERSVAGIVTDSLLVSQGAGELKSLFSLINDPESSMREPAQRRRLLKAAATEIGHFHRSGLFHGDLHLNNLLCQETDKEWIFVWMDNEEGCTYRSLPDSKRIHDLNHINRYKHSLSRSERMLMWITYLKATDDLSRERQKRILHQVISQGLAYMRKRGWLDPIRKGWNSEIDYRPIQ